MTVIGPRLPSARGPLSDHLFTHLARRPHEMPPLPAGGGDSLAGDDFHLALYACYELHYQGFAGVDDAWEWEPSLLAARRGLEEQFADRLAGELGPWSGSGDLDVALQEVIDGGEGPSLSRMMLERGTLAQFRELAVHRSAYQLKEADPHTWGIPRLTGGPKASLVEIQCDEYGSGDESKMHSTLFAQTMAALGLDPAYGAYLDALPGTTLATVNLISLFGLHRRWRGALAGHLAVFESTSVGPMTRYAATLDRLGLGAEGALFYKVHVGVDAHHEVIARKGLAGALAAAEPDLAPDIVFGARALMFVESRLTRQVLDAWGSGHSSLLRPVPASPPATNTP